MGIISRGPFIGGIPCVMTITIEEKSFFLAEAAKPEKARKLRRSAIELAFGDDYDVKSALDEKGINAFVCKICEMIQTCAYGIADITGNNANVLFELGMMIGLGKPTIILKKRNKKGGLSLPSDLKALEVVPFNEYKDVIVPLTNL